MSFVRMSVAGRFFASTRPAGARSRAVAVSSHTAPKSVAAHLHVLPLRRRCYGLSARCRFVLELRKFRSRMRPWIAMVAAYALALQVLLSGIAGAHAMAAGSLSGELFVICHGSGDGPADNQNVPDTPRPATPCV